MTAANTRYEEGALVSATPRANQKVFGQWLYDAYGEGDASPYGSRKTFGFNQIETTNYQGRIALDDIRTNAYWQLGITFDPVCITNFPTVASVSLFVKESQKISDARHDFTFECALTDGIPPVRTYPYFEVANPPSSIDFAAETNISGYDPGSISALLYDRNGQIVASMTAIGVSADGLAATFPTPYVVSDMYGVGLVGTASDGSTHFLGSSSLVAGSTIQNQARAFGVDGGVISNSFVSCQTPDIYNDGTYAGQEVCQSYNGETRFPVVSLYDANQISFNGATVNVGVHPTTVLTYGSFFSEDYEAQNCCNYTDSQQQGTRYAIVLNSGSNSVSIVDLQYAYVVATLSAGVQPTAVSLSPAGSQAYVVSYDGTVTRIDLSSFTVSGSTYAGVHPTSVSVNQANMVTVGGENFVASLDGNSMTITASQATSGSSIGLASLDDNQTVFASAMNVGGSTNMAITRMTNNLSSSSTVQQGIDASSYSSSSLASSLVSPGLMANGLRAGIGSRGFIVATTPSGFSAFDRSGNLLITGEIPGLTRSIGLDPDGTVVYFASPDSNSIVVVPLPNPPVQDDPGEIHFLAQ